MCIIDRLGESKHLLIVLIRLADVSENPQWYDEHHLISTRKTPSQSAGPINVEHRCIRKHPCEL